MRATARQRDTARHCAAYLLEEQEHLTHQLDAARAQLATIRALARAELTGHGTPEALRATLQAIDDVTTRPDGQCP